MTKTVPLAYGQGTVEAVLGYDDVSVGGMTAHGQGINLMYDEDINGFEGSSFDGIMGLAWIVEKHHRRDVFTEFIRSNPEMPPLFSLFLTPQENQVGSELIVGGLDDQIIGLGPQSTSLNIVSPPGGEALLSPLVTVSGTARKPDIG